jgi:plasmid stabilization system protein ParE
MKRRMVRVGPRADADIRGIGSYIAYLGAPESGVGYVLRLSEFVLRLDMASERGQARDDIKAGLRVIPFEKSAAIAVVVSDTLVQVVRVFYRGQNWERALRSQFRRSR